MNGEKNSGCLHTFEIHVDRFRPKKGLLLLLYRSLSPMLRIDIRTIRISSKTTSTGKFMPHKDTGDISTVPHHVICIVGVVASRGGVRRSRGGCIHRASEFLQNTVPLHCTMVACRP